MRTLFVSTTVPYPLNTGANQRIFHLLRALARLSDVTFACPTDGGRWPPELDALRPLFQHALLFPSDSFDASRLARKPGLRGRLARLARFHGHLSEPALVRWYRSAAGTQLIHKACQTGFDLVWVERLLSIGLIPADPGGRVIIDLDDLLHRKVGHRLRQTRPRPLTLLDMLEYIKLRRMERTLVQGPYELVVCSSLDKQILGGGSRVWVIPNGIEVPTSSSWKPPAGPYPVFVLVGAMSTEANADAAHFFVRRILPRIRETIPEARTLIVGSHPNQSVRDLHDGRSVTVTGTVPSVVPFLRQASLSVVPIRFGGGTRIKILESFAHGVPVVSTRVGAEGLEVEDGRHLVLADSPTEFAAACIRLVRDPARCAELSREGLSLVQARYEWRAIEQQVEHVVRAGRPASVGGG